MNPKTPDPNMNMERRLLLAFALMGVVLMVSTYLMPKPAEPKAGPSKTAETAKQESRTDTKAEAKSEAAKKAAESARPPAEKAAENPSETPKQGRIVASREDTVVVETDLYRVVFSNRGAVIRSWILRKYQDRQGQPLELVSQKGLEKVRPPFSVRFHEGQSADAVNTGLWVPEISAGGLTVSFSYANGPWSGKKTFAFRKDSYLTSVESEIRNSGSAKPHLLYWRGGFGDASVIGAAASQLTVRFDRNEQKLITLNADAARKAEGGYQAHRGPFTFAGITDAYFAAVALPESATDFEIHSLSDQVPNEIDAKEEPNAGMAVGGHGTNKFEMFVGPKDTNLLRSIDPRLENLIDFGRLKIIAKPLFLAMHYLNDNYLHNYGWTIVIITIVINFLLLPLKFTSLKSMKKMSALQPEIAAINDKYKGMSYKDPRKQNQQAEVMDLYKKHGVNPVGGCVPMVIQIPFFIAFYTVLSVAIELRGAHWLWVTDLSRPEDLAIRVLPVIMVASQFLMQKMTPTTTADPSQQRIMYMMPLFMGFMFYGVSSGLVLYWMTSNLVGIAQQWFFNHTGAAAQVPAAAGAKAVQKKDKKR
ncbi:MAG: membrane protein insertase YidC [Bryobacteraceae bacterium]